MEVAFELGSKDVRRKSSKESKNSTESVTLIAPNISVQPAGRQMAFSHVRCSVQVPLGPC